MLYNNNCYVHLEASHGISRREDFRIIDISKSFRISRTIFDSVQNTFKRNLLGFILVTLQDFILEFY